MGHRDAKNGISDAPEERYEFSISLAGSTAAVSTPSRFAPTTASKMSKRKTTIRVPEVLVLRRPRRFDPLDTVFP